MQARYLLGALSCLIAAVLWGIVFPVISYILIYLDAISLSTLRFLFTAVSLMIVLVIVEGFSVFKISFKQGILLWLLGLLGFPASAVLTSLAQTIIGKEGALNVALIMATSPLISLIILSIIRRTVPSILTVLFIIASVLGLVLVITKGNIFAIFDVSNHPFANLLIVIATLNFVLYTLGGTLFKEFSALKYSAFTTAFGLISMLVFDIILIEKSIWQLPSLESVIKVMPQLLYISVIGTALGFLLWNYGNKTITPLNGILFFNITPITSVSVLMFLNIYPNAIQVLGIAITLLSLILNNINQRRTKIILKSVTK